MGRHPDQGTVGNNGDNTHCLEGKLPHANVSGGLRERPFENLAHLQGIRVDLRDVVQDHQQSGQGVDTGEQADIAE